MNGSMLLTKDTTEAITAFLQKRKPTFAKLWFINNIRWILFKGIIVVENIEF